MISKVLYCYVSEKANKILQLKEIKNYNNVAKFLGICGLRIFLYCKNKSGK